MTKAHCFSSGNISVLQITAESQTKEKSPFSAFNYIHEGLIFIVYIYSIYADHNIIIRRRASSCVNLVRNRFEFQNHAL